MYCVLVEKRVINNIWHNGRWKTIIPERYEFVIPCGSTNWIKLDGRNSINNLIADCKEILNKSISFKKYDGFILVRSTKDEIQDSIFQSF